MEQTFHCPSFPTLQFDLNARFDVPITPEEHVAVVRESPPPYAAKA